MANKISSRQSEHRSQLTQISGTDSKPPLNEVLPAIDSELTPPLVLRSSSTPDLIVSVGAGVITNPTSGKNRTFAPINREHFTFNGSTITLPASASGASDIINSAGDNITSYTQTASTFAKCAVFLNKNNEIVLKIGTGAASIALAEFPSVVDGALPVGYFIIETDGSQNIQNVTPSYIYQMEGGGGGSGVGSVFEIEQTSHGFAAFDCIYFNSTSGDWEKADTTADSKAAIYCVSEVISTDVFNAIRQGRLTIESHGKTVGEYYYLSSTAGAASTANPDPANDNFFQLIFHVEDTNTINFLVSAPSIIQSTLLVDPMTTNGDMIIQSGGTSSRLPIGSANEILTVSGGLPSWSYEIKDEDDMVSNSDTAVPTQQSVKAYVDQSFVKPARYTTNAGQSLPHNNNPILDFEDVDFDGDSIVTTGASWRCTPGETGYYAVAATIDINFGTNTAYRGRLRLFKNNSEYSNGEWKSGTTPASYSDVGLHIFDVVDITSVTDYIDVRCTQVNGSAAAKSISASSPRNHIKIFKIREL